MSALEGGGIGSMLQSHIAQGSDKGGFMDLTGVIKGIDTNVLSTQAGNVDAIGQQLGGGFGLQSAATLGIDQFKSAFGLPNIISEMTQCQSELAQGVQRYGNAMWGAGMSGFGDASPFGYHSPSPTPGMSHGGMGIDAY